MVREGGKGQCCTAGGLALPHHRSRRRSQLTTSFQPVPTSCPAVPVSTWLAPSLPEPLIPWQHLCQARSLGPTTSSVCPQDNRALLLGSQLLGTLFFLSHLPCEGLPGPSSQPHWASGHVLLLLHRDPHSPSWDLPPSASLLLLHLGQLLYPGRPGESWEVHFQPSGAAAGDELGLRRSLMESPEATVKSAEFLT